MLWCGSLRVAATQQATTLREIGQQQQQVDLDFPASCNDLWLAVEAARALGASPRDMHAFVFDADVLPPGFAGVRHSATAADLERVTESLTRTIRPEDVLLFVASNHGVPEGLLTSIEDVDAFENRSPLLTPTLLGDSLGRLPGKQILIVATCHAGCFLPLGERPERTVLTACTKDETYYLGVSADDVPHSLFLRLLLCAWTGTTVPFGSYNPIPRRQLVEAFEHTKQELLSLRRQCPLMSGAITLL